MGSQSMKGEGIDVERREPEHGPSWELDSSSKAFGEAPITVMPVVDKCMDMAESPEEYSFCMYQQAREMTVRDVESVDIVETDELVSLKVNMGNRANFYINLEGGDLRERDIPDGWTDWVEKVNEGEVRL